MNLSKKLKAIPLFSTFSDQLISRLLNDCSFKFFEDGDRIFNAGESAEYCYIVCYGAVRICRNLPSGKEIVMSFCRPGDLVAALIMVSPSPRYPVTSTATEASGLIKIPRQQYLAAWQADPSVARAVTLHITSRLMEFQEDKAMAVAPVPQRIAHFILRILERQPPGYGNRLNLKLARRDIAERVGTSVETVIRILSQWTQNGWIATFDQHIEVFDRNALQQVVDKE